MISNNRKINLQSLPFSLNWLSRTEDKLSFIKLRYLGASVTVNLKFVSDYFQKYGQAVNIDIIHLIRFLCIRARHQPLKMAAQLKLKSY